MNVEEVLDDLGFDSGNNHGGLKVSNGNFMVRCKFHNDSDPSMGVNMDEGYGQCFSCLERFTLPKLVAHTKGWFTTNQKGENVYDYKKAIEYLIDFGYQEPEGLSTMTVNRLFKSGFDEEIEELPPMHGRQVLENYQVAPYKCGKETHEFYYERGFDDDDVIKFRVGWDKIMKRVILPAYHYDGKLCGATGRAILHEDHPLYRKWYSGANEPKYLIYFNSPIGEFLYPEWLFKPREFTDKRGRKRKRAILVEGYLDAQRMHKYGFEETLSHTRLNLSVDKETKRCYQIEYLLFMGVTDVYLMGDNDKAGRIGAKINYHLLKEFFKVHLVRYPKYKKDPDSMTKRQVMMAIFRAKPYKQAVTRIRRLN